MLYTTAIALLGATAASAQFSMTQLQTPPTQCKSTNVTWSGGTAPYLLTANPAGSLSSPPAAVLTNGTSDHAYTWLVDLPQGTRFDLRIKDATGVEVFSMPYTVRNGTADCTLNTQAAAAISAAQASARAEATSGATASPSASAHPSSAVAVAAVPGLAVAAAVAAAAVLL